MAPFQICPQEIGRGSPKPEEPGRRPQTTTVLPFFTKPKREPVLVEGRQGGQCHGNQNGRDFVTSVGKKKANVEALLSQTIGDYAESCCHHCAQGHANSKAASSFGQLMDKSSRAQIAIGIIMATAAVFPPSAGHWKSPHKMPGQTKRPRLHKPKVCPLTLFDLSKAGPLSG